jgi:hypothetical protein
MSKKKLKKVSITKMWQVSLTHLETELTWFFIGQFFLKIRFAKLTWFFSGELILTNKNNYFNFH